MIVAPPHGLPRNGRSLKELVEKYSKPLQSVNLGESFLYVYDYAHSRYVYLAESFHKITGYPSCLILNNKVDFITKYMSPDDFPPYRKIMQKWSDFYFSIPIRERSYYRACFDFRFRCSDGVCKRLLHQYLHFEYDRREKLQYCMVNCSDITHWKKGNNMVLNIIGPNPASSLTYTPGICQKLERKPFTKAEKAIIKLLSEGFSSKDISSELHITFNTANTHRRNLLKKAQVRNTNELVTYAYENSLI